MSISKLLMSTTAPPGETGILNLGKNCHQCHRLDFLPFQCSFCKETFCSDHRTPDIHDCPKNRQFTVPRQASASPSQGPTAASLFPDRAKHQQQLDSLFKEPVSEAAGLKGSPLVKLTKFLHLQRLKRKDKLFWKKSKPSVTADLVAMKKTAKGPASVAIADRVYVWVLFLDRSDSELDQINVEKDRKAVWVLKQWPVGRALDSVADTLKIANNNNTTSTELQRLNLFKVEADTPQLLQTSSRVAQLVPNGATLYLVKGAM